MVGKTIWWAAVLIGAFLVLTRYTAANELIRSGFRGAVGVAGVLQGRSVTLGSSSTSVGAIAR